MANRTLAETMATTTHQTTTMEKKERRAAAFALAVAMEAVTSPVLLQRPRPDRRGLWLLATVVRRNTVEFGVIADAGRDNPHTRKQNAEPETRQASGEGA